VILAAMEVVGQQPDTVDAWDEAVAAFPARLAPLF